MQDNILALFDFCETITNFQTLEDFRNEISIKFQKPRKHIDGIKYPELNNMPVEIIRAFSKEFVYTKILPNINKSIIEKVFWHQDQGHQIVIVSGGLEIYINEFAKIYGIEKVVAIELEVFENKFTGNISGIHTMQERKLYKLIQKINLNNYNLKDSYAYSDCVSDIPLLSLVGNPNVIETPKDLTWAKILKYNILK
ncbi:HAD-IB family hydrolase [Campylobacter lari]|uniref:HAD-IB family hydrolase n=1 Tax=Campylobacter lari TaxID=201 RepID=UPI00127514CC|nr:HAD-IB family hydrolase [Campylobacter lari]EAH8848401.1 HAD-IB family hydrolase [Campylobacter lari]EAJ5709290.1 HAD-IB family hydrolase [Campylobacter lari]EAK5847432.1 HAD-IB family hydrolase [Campylobacter lari]EDP6874639.1 HAD-IB family hydrolase [Campylobacter lari]EHS0799438.1 HAD-IB family hydrolase [Campylobacter lari]